MPGKFLVRNIPPDVDEEQTLAQLRELFSTVGRVLDLKWIDRPVETKTAFVRMKNDEVAWKVIDQYNNHLLNDIPITLTPSAGLLSREIAAQLGEVYKVPIGQIKQIVAVMGPDFALEKLDETLRIEEEGGMMLPNGSRRRTTGGIFFYLVRNALSPELRVEIFTESKAKRRRELKLARQGAAPPQSQPQPKAQPDETSNLPALVWAERLDLLRQLVQEIGKATTVKVTLIGRPGRVEMRQNVVITTVESVIKGTFPKGVPAPPQTPTTYAVYIGSKQWKNVEQAITNPEDVLIIEGSCAYDPDLKGIAVFATNVATKLQQQAKRNQQKAAAGQTEQSDTPQTASPAAPAAPPKAAASPAQAKPAAKPTAPPPAAPVVHDGPPPPEAIRELARLRQTEDDARNRLDEIKELPADEQAGLGQALREVQQTKEAIKALLQKYPRLVK